MLAAVRLLLVAVTAQLLCGGSVAGGAGSPPPVSGPAAAGASLKFLEGAAQRLAIVDRQRRFGGDEQTAPADPLAMDGCTMLSGRCTWERTFGGALPDKAYGVAALPDGGAVVVGHTRGLGIGHDIFMLRADRAGRIVWQRTLRARAEDHAYGVVVLDSDLIVLSGFTRSQGAGRNDAWVHCVDLTGATVWERTFGGPLNDRSRTIAATADQDLVIAGLTQSRGDPAGDGWIVKLDRHGRKLWERTYGGDREDGIFQMQALSDGSLLAAGYTDAGGTRGFDLWVLKLDRDGELLWERRFDRNGFDAGTAVAAAPDGGCVVAGLTSENGPRDDQAWIVRLDNAGGLVWQRLFGGEKNDGAWALARHGAAGHLLVMASASSGRGSVDAWLMMLDGDGNTTWEQRYGGRLWDRPTAAVPTGDGGFYVGGYTTSKGAGYEDFWLLRLDENGDI